MNTHAISGATAAAAAAATPGAVRQLSFIQGASLHNLKQLMVMRNIAIVAQVSTVLVIYRGLSIDLPVGPMMSIIAVLALLNLGTWFYVNSGRPVSDSALLFQLLADVAALALLLGLSGGATNPFVGMFVLPLTITAACLGSSFTWLVALASVGAYSMLVLAYRPVFAAGDEARQLQLLVSGMWVNYAITAGMIAHFVVGIASNLRQSQQAQASSRERELAQEHLMRIGTLAAGAAHELAQPLSTMSVILDELEELQAHPSANGQGSEQQILVQGLSQQLRNCKVTLSGLLSYGQQTIDTRFERKPFDAFADRCVEAFRVRRPRARVHVQLLSPGPAPSVSCDEALRQAVLNLLGNAADMSTEPIEIELSWDEEQLYLSIRDHGPGLPAAAEQQVGKLFFTTKPSGSGNGLGLCLAQVAITRLGGSLQLANADGGGALARIVLPVATAAEH